MTQQEIDMVTLGQAVKRRREEMRMNLRDCAAVTNVSASTLSRLESGIGNLDTRNVFSITKWLNAPVERFLAVDAPRPIVYYPQESTPEIVRAVLGADRRLTEKDSVAIGNIVDELYKALAS